MFKVQPKMQFYVHKTALDYENIFCGLIFHWTLHVCLYLTRHFVIDGQQNSAK